MKTSPNNAPVQKNDSTKSVRHCGRNNTHLVTKTETFRSGSDAQKRALQLQDENVYRVIILQKIIEVFYVRYQISR
jgi:hypothetical protein